TLTIAQGSNILAQTASYMQLRDIKQMYERWTVGDVPSQPPRSQPYLASEGLPTGTPRFEYGTAVSNTPYILFVHGWNLDVWLKDGFAETAFKRLYWQGYDGRFGSFRWPTDFGFQATLLHIAFDSKNFDDSEANAWRSSAGLLNLLT